MGRRGKPTFYPSQEENLPVLGMKVIDIKHFYQKVDWSPQILVLWTQHLSLLLVRQSGNHQINFGKTADATELIHSFQLCHHGKSTLETNGKA